jgi:hypothetical protein
LNLIYSTLFTNRDVGIYVLITLIMVSGIYVDMKFKDISKLMVLASFGNFIYYFYLGRFLLELNSGPQDYFGLLLTFSGEQFLSQVLTHLVKSNSF